MSAHLLCAEDEEIACPATFNLRASGWIDHTNIGETKLKSPPPAGVRLRWSCPFISEPANQRTGKPLKYLVQRAGPLHPNVLTRYVPTVGHPPRSPTPLNLWRPLDRLNSLTYATLGPSCTAVEAVYFELHSNSPTVIVSLIDTTGRAQVTAEVGPSDRFYFELTSLKTVAFSATPVLKTDPVGLALIAQGDERAHFEYQTIAEIAASSWHTHDFKTITERLSNAAGQAFTTLKDAEWEELCTFGRELNDAFDTQRDVPENIQNALLLAGGTRFDVATLIGWGFIDGEHPTRRRVDNIVDRAMLRSAADSVYVYRVVAQLSTGAGGNVVEIPSTPAFAWIEHAPLPSKTHCRLVPVPVSRSEVTNHINPGDREDNPSRVSNTTESVTCTSSWEIRSHLPATEFVVTKPTADRSLITGAQQADPGEFLSGSNLPPLNIEKLELVEIRRHQFAVPYFDSDVGLELEARDAWDRCVRCDPSPKKQPEIDYVGTCIPVSNVASSTNGTRQVDIELDRKSGWKADALATYAKGEIVVLMRDPAAILIDMEVQIGSPFPSSDEHWCALIAGPFTEVQLALLVGGTLEVNGFVARLIRFTPIVNHQSVCTFEVDTTCAGASLYTCASGTAKAYLHESASSDQLWIALDGAVPLLPDGLPSAYTTRCRLPELRASGTLHFATRMQFSFDGPYHSSISTPFAFPYVHTAPSKPEFCCSIHQLGSDYYGREFVRATVENCDVFDKELSGQLTVAAGAITEPTEYMSARSTGVLGSQRPFNQTALFEALGSLADHVEGSTSTLGVSYVRTEDGRESLPLLRPFTVRKTS